MAVCTTVRVSVCRLVTSTLSQPVVNKVWPWWSRRHLHPSSLNTEMVAKARFQCIFYGGRKRCSATFWKSVRNLRDRFGLRTQVSLQSVLLIISYRRGVGWLFVTVLWVCQVRNALTATPTPILNYGLSCFIAVITAVNYCLKGSASHYANAVIPASFTNNLSDEWYHVFCFCAVVDPAGLFSPIAPQ